MTFKSVDQSDNWQEYKSIILDKRLVCDLEMIMNGGFSPLTGFLKEEDYNGVVEHMRLTDGSLWTIPIVLPVNKDEVELGNKVVLRDETLYPLAVMDIDSLWKPDLTNECVKCYGSDDDNHPYVKIVLSREGMLYAGGEIRKINDVLHYDFRNFRKNIWEVRELLKDESKVLGFQTRNPMHRSHYELTRYAMKVAGDGTKLLLNPVVGITQDCDVDYGLRVRCYKKLMKYYGDDAVLVLLPLSMRMAGPREAVWHAQIRKNYGCTHFVVGRDHAGPSYKKKNGESFYGPYDAHELVNKVSDEIGINVIMSTMIVYVKELGEYRKIDEVPEGMTVLNISGTEQRRMLRDGEDIPEWFSFAEIITELKKDFGRKKGICVYFIGLSGSGKSTIAEALKGRMIEEDGIEITVLDGDIVRRELSKGLGFDRESRSINVRRIGYVASEIVKHGGIVFCANIAPYEEDRRVNRERIIGVGGRYVEVYVRTSISDCEKRDVKGLYKLAREGKIKEFTGISDPFEEPANSDVIIDGGNGVSLEDNIKKILSKIYVN